LFIPSEQNNFAPEFNYGFMDKIKSPAELLELKNNLRTRSMNTAGQPILVRVAMATCGIASGAREVKDIFTEEFTKRNIDARVTQTGCMGYCYAEPTVEITMPGCEPVTFGYVDIKKASRIIDKYVLNNELVDGIIPTNYETVGNL
jgi:NADP-reducing hydrogenase subunit HndB